MERLSDIKISFEFDELERIKKNFESLKNYRNQHEAFLKNEKEKTVMFYIRNNKSFQKAVSLFVNNFDDIFQEGRLWDARLAPLREKYKNYGLPKNKS